MPREASRCVLVLDDEPDARELIRLVLEPSGYTVYCMEDGEEALTLMETRKVAVALVDLLMPGMSGKQFLVRVSELPEEKRPVCIVNSARRPREIESDLEGLDVFDIVTKPFELDDLERRIGLAWEEKKRRTRS